MPHKLVKTLGLVTAALRYQCRCDNQEIIAINYVFQPEDIEDEQRYLMIMSALREDMLTEIRQHTGVGRG